MRKFASSASCVILALLINSWSSVWRYGTERATESKLGKLLDKYLHDSIQWNSEYIVAKNVFRRNAYESYEDVTLVTQCSVNNLHYLIHMAGRWKGPVSVAVLTPGEDGVKAILGSYWLMKCFPRVFDQVSFHFVYPSDHAPTRSSALSAIQLLHHPNRGHNNFCTNAVKLLRDFHRGNNYELNGIEYPHNTLRNIALEWVKSKYVLVLDVDTFPSNGIRENFLNYTSSSHFANLPSRARSVYIIPAFEAKSENPRQLPVTKSELVKFFKRTHVRTFHTETCRNCHEGEK